MCRWNTIYGKASPYKFASWTASLVLHMNFRTVTSEQYFGDTFIENLQLHIFLA
jgi:hypothetical protein